MAVVRILLFTALFCLPLPFLVRTGLKAPAERAVYASNPCHRPPPCPVLALPTARQEGTPKLTQRVLTRCPSLHAGTEEGARRIVVVSAPLPVGPPSRKKRAAA